METMLHPPKTALELFKILPEGTQCQLIYNHIIMSPSPKWKHQDIVKKILVTMEIYLRKNNCGKVLSDVDVYLNEENVYRPDVLFIANEQMQILGDDGYVHGAPLLVIEVLSQGTAAYDKKEKKEMYAACGVREYWLVDQTTLQCTGFKNNNGIFTEVSKTQEYFTLQLFDLTIQLGS